MPMDLACTQKGQKWNVPSLSRTRTNMDFKFTDLSFEKAALKISVSLIDDFYDYKQCNVTSMYTMRYRKMQRLTTSSKMQCARIANDVIMGMVY